MLKQAAWMIFGTALALSACTRKEQPGRREATREDTEQTVTRQSPGQFSGEVEREKGHGDVTIEKETTTTKRETDKERIPTVVQKQEKADINRMTKDDFVALGLSEQEAEQIVQYRKDHGNFSSPDQLRDVPGINMAWLGKNSSKLSVS